MKHPPTDHFETLAIRCQGERSAFQEHSASITRTIVTHPASTTHAKLTEAERLATGITPGLVRISAGLETEADIVADIEQAIG
jgi:O-acetylhomoserine/O-acetylserine sulfhydrylase-like pyridoxal-dependent enzyme